ncbi:glycosyltransferase [Pseudomonas sp. N40(2020)]|uniref:glycosyltransferase family 2 protein n=1 Tax=Pseudomonas sp. N40(2020) TaxID=2767798 RepID=UPI0016575173|nr:glycosyltransferase family 2 protein [Pseudomonas sp. N40(2020)]MBC8999900.1 glycosyltransferase [Pseudomonas sp. N40(2020)]
MIVPKISVVIPTYNVESYIAETLDSLINQPIALHEIILINDGSTDGTLALLEAGYGDRPEVKVVTQVNQGVGAARRNGLALATGEYVFFCDPDDVVSPEMFSTLVEQVQANPALELFYFSKRSYTEVDGKKQLLRRNTAASRNGWFDAGRDLLEDLILSGKYHAATWQYIFKRSVCERFAVRLEGRAHEDHVFSMNIYLHSQATFATAADYYFQRVRSGSLTQSHKDVEYVMGSYAAYRDTLAALKKHIVSFNAGREVALNFMERNVNALITKCIKYGVPLPKQITAMTRQDSRDCGVKLHPRWMLMFPRVAHGIRKLRFTVKQLRKSRRASVQG